MFDLLKLSPISFTLLDIAKTHSNVSGKEILDNSSAQRPKRTSLVALFTFVMSEGAVLYCASMGGALKPHATSI